MTVQGGERFDWEALVPLTIHPIKVMILEALEWIGQPLSASDLTKVFDDEDIYLSHVSYHLRKLGETGVLELRRTRPVRGSIEKFYCFPWI